MAEPDPPVPDGPAVPRVANRYRLGHLIASGGMAQVWEATDDVLGRPVAVKILHSHLASDQAFVARFRAEAVSAARLTHPSIVSIYDTSSHDGVEAIVMELVRGTTLRHLIDHRGVIEPSEAVTIADHVAAALEVAHRAGIVHRDIKPANVLLSTDGRVLVTDFGIAKAIEGNDLTTERSMLGTAKYLSPEQVEGTPVDGRADLYALGVVLYEMLCGEPPFRADTEAATALARLHRDPEPPRRLRPEIPADLEAVVLRCLARDPAGRPADASALRRDLAGIGTHPTGAPSSYPPSGSTPSVPAPPGPTPPPPHDTSSDSGSTSGDTSGDTRRGRGRAWVLAAVVVGAALVAAAIVFTAGGGGGDPVAIVGAAAFDPLGTPPGDENNDRAAFAIDGDPATSWVTETYRDPEAMAGKDGVGLAVTLSRTEEISSVVVDGPSANWSARAYVATSDLPGDLAGWGEPVAGVTGVGPGPVTLDLGGVQGSAVLVWFTRTGDDGRVEVTELDVLTR